jgi:hypothetical protein
MATGEVVTYVSLVRTKTFCTKGSLKSVFPTFLIERIKIYQQKWCPKWVNIEREIHEAYLEKKLFDNMIIQIFMADVRQFTIHAFRSL